MVLAPLGAAEGPLPTENQAGAVSRAGPWLSWDQLQSPAAPPLADPGLGMLQFASVYIPGQQNDSMQGLGRVTATTANMCLLEKLFAHCLEGRGQGQRRTHTKGVSAV